MRAETVDYLRCNSCGGRILPGDINEESDGDIRTGKLICGECGAEYPIEDGIVDFLVEVDPVIRNEIEGWEKMYSPKTVEQRPEWVLSLPYLTPEIDPDENSRDIWKRNGDIFHQMVSKLELKGGERVLELGASTCWATQQWVEYGCEAVAIDITKSLYYGVKSGQLWMDDRGSYFERILCDMRKTPFENGFFDIVFACAAMHHSPDIKETFREIGRILKKGGRFACIAEPLSNVIGGTELSQRELELGINENTYSIFEWRKAISGGGMKPKPFLDFYYKEDIKGLTKIRKEKAYSPNPVKRFVKSFAFSGLLPARLRVNAIMLTSQMTCFNVVAEKK